MDSIMTAITTFGSTAIGMASDVGTTVVASPLLLTFCVSGFVGLGIGIFKRLANIK